MHNKPHSDAAKQKMSKAHSGVPLPHKRRPSRVVGGIELWSCGTCGQFFPRDWFYRNKRTLLGITSECRKCHTETNLRTRDKENARRLGRESMALTRKAEPERHRERDRIAARKRVWTPQMEARYQLNLAVKRGEIMRPNRCAKCGEYRSLHAHHPDYSHHLYVEWLCTICHGAEHHAPIS